MVGPGFTPGIAQLYELLGQVGGCSSAAEAEELQREDQRLLAEALSKCPRDMLNHYSLDYVAKCDCRVGSLCWTHAHMRFLLCI